MTKSKTNTKLKNTPKTTLFKTSKCIKSDETSELKTTLIKIKIDKLSIALLIFTSFLLKEKFIVSPFKMMDHSILLVRLKDGSNILMFQDHDNHFYV